MYESSSLVPCIAPVRGQPSLYPVDCVSIDPAHNLQLQLGPGEIHRQPWVPSEYPSQVWSLSLSLYLSLSLSLSLTHTHTHTYTVCCNSANALTCSILIIKKPYISALSMRFVRINGSCTTCHCSRNCCRKEEVRRPCCPWGKLLTS